MAQPVRILVLGGQGQAVPGAVLIPGSGARRQLGPTEPGVIGVSDDSGLILVTPEELGEGTGFLVVSNTYLPGRVERSSLADFEETVTLDTGHSQLVRCLDLDERPVPGVQVLLSSASLPERAPEGAVSGGRLDAVHFAETDLLGVASLVGLPEGAYTLRLDSDEYSILRGAPTEAIRPPGPEIDLVLGALACGVYRVEGDEVIAHRVLMYDNYRLTALAQDDVGLLKGRLQAAYPDDIAIAALRAGGDSPRAKLRVLLRENGLQDFEIDLKPEKEWSSPETLPVTKGQACEAVQLVVLDDKAREVEIPEFDVLLGEGFMEGLIVYLDSGEESWLPAGTYTVGHHNPWIRSALLSDRTLSVPGSCVLQLDHSFAPCRFVIADMDGARVQPALLRLRSQGTERTFTLTTPELETWLPVGTVEAQLEVYGYADRDFVVEVEDALAPRTFELRPDRIVER